SQGTCLWSRSMGDAEKQEPYGIALDGSGNVVVVGRFAGTLDFGEGSAPLVSAGGVDVFVAKLNPGGHTLWSKRFGEIQDQEGWGVSVGADDQIVITGRFQYMMDVGQVGDELMSAGDLDTFVMALDPMGNHLWSTSFGTPSPDMGYGVAL